MSFLNLSLSDLPETQANGPIPAGWVKAFISDGEMRPTRDGLNEYLQLRFTLSGNPSNDNRNVWGNYNINHSNATAVEIAKRDLASIMKATNLEKVGQIAELFNKPLEIKLAIEESAGYEPRNVIKAYRPVKAGGFGTETPIPF